MKIPIFDLKRQYESLHGEFDYAIKKVLKNGIFTMGPEVGLFEREFAEYIGSQGAVGLASGTDALTLALRAYDIQPGESVIVPANAYPSAFGIAMAGVKIKLVDVDHQGNIDLPSLQRALTKSVKAVVAVHLYGNPADMLGIRELLKRQNDVPLFIEDAAQAHGAAIKIGSEWRKVGTFGDIGCFSFYPTKNLGAYGDGGMIVSNTKSILMRLRRLRMYGEEDRYKSVEVSGISRLDEIQAAVLRVKLQYLDEWVKRREVIAKYYAQEFSDISEVVPISIPTDHNRKSAHHLFVIRTKKRESLIKYLTKEGIGTGIHYPLPIHMSLAFKSLGYEKGDFPETESLSQEVVSLPLFPELTDAEIETVASTVRKFYS